MNHDHGPLLSVVVNFRTPEMTLRAVESLWSQQKGISQSRVIVVDNASDDGSYELIQSQLATIDHDGRIELLLSPRNGGFGYGVNVALRHALQKNEPIGHVYLLNSDAFPDSGAVERLLSFQRMNPSAAIVGSYIHGPAGEPHNTAFRFPTLLGEVVGTLRLGLVSRLFPDSEIAMALPKEPARVDWLAGASMMIRRDVLDSVGLFDEGFFLYYEETDYCKRAAEAGFQIWYVPSSSVAHIGGASTGFKAIDRPRPRYWFESRRRYILKHHGRMYLYASNAIWLICHCVWRVRRWIQRLPDDDPPRLGRDFARMSFP